MEFKNPGAVFRLTKQILTYILTTTLNNNKYCLNI